ncbi:MAG: integrase arm-type DNA-binding domain-containing protein [Thermostichus sp. HHBFW_bins_43]
MLNDLKMRTLKPREKSFKVFDGDGLYLEVMPSGSRLWRVKYRFQGKEKRLSLGRYPEVGLKAAREKCFEIRRELAAGRDPAQTRREEAARAKGACSFGAMAEEWYEIQQLGWSPRHAETVRQRLDQHILPALGSLEVGSVDGPAVSATVRGLEARGTVETARRCLGIVSQVMRFGIATGRATSDPCPALRGSLSPVKPRHFAAVTNPEELGSLLRLIYSYPGFPVVVAALKLAPLWFVRPGELRHARWKDIDVDRAEWRFVLSKTKQPHIVPLAQQAIRILEEIRPLTESTGWVFPGRDSSRPLSNMAVLSALRSLGIPSTTATGHGFRATARTLLEEELGYAPHVIEQQLGHMVRDPLGRAYNRTVHLKIRREMMQVWADYLDELREKRSIIIPTKNALEV